MKSLIFIFFMTILNANFIEEEKSIYNFVLNDLIKQYSIESIVLLDNQGFFVPIPNQNCKLDVYKLISNKGDIIQSESDTIENFGEIIKSPLIKYRILQIEIDTCFLDTNASAEKGWEKFYERYPRSNSIISLSPIIYIKKKSISYIYSAYLFEGRGVGELYKLKRIKKRWSIIDKHTMWVAH